MPNIKTTTVPQPDQWGTFVSQGMRIGPSAMEEGVLLPPLDTPGQRYSGSQLEAARQRVEGLDQWGPGVYTGGLFTYRILPTAAIESTAAAPSASRGQSNVVSSFFLTSALNGTSLPLSGDAFTEGTTNSIASFLSTSQGVSRLVLDFPRCISVREQAGQTATFNLKVYGADLYGQKMMETIPVGASGGSDLQVYGRKAFAFIDAVYLTDIVGVPVVSKYVAIGTSNIFGLPFALGQAAHVVWYSQGDVQMQAATAALNPTQPGYAEVSAWWPINTGDVPAAQYDTYTGATGGTANPVVRNFDILPYQAGLPYRLNGADTTTATSTTADVRGTVWPQSQFKWGSVASPQVFGAGFIQDTTESQWCAALAPYISITYYIAGADMYQNQLLARQKFLTASYNIPVSNNAPVAAMWKGVTPYRDQNGIKGVAQYWEDTP